MWLTVIRFWGQFAKSGNPDDWLAVRLDWGVCQTTQWVLALFFALVVSFVNFKQASHFCWCRQFGGHHNRWLKYNAATSISTLATTDIQTDHITICTCTRGNMYISYLFKILYEHTCIMCRDILGSLAVMVMWFSVSVSTANTVITV